MSADKAAEVKRRRREALSRLSHLARPEAGRIALGLSALAVNSATNLSFPWILGQAVDRAGDSNYVAFIAGAAGMFLVGSAASWVRVYCLGTSTERISARIRRLIFESYLDKEVEFFESSTSGELMTILDKDVTTAAEMLTEKVSAGLRSLNSSINGSVVLFSIAPQLCTVSLAIVPVVGVGAMMLSKYSRKLREKARELEARMLSFALERVGSISTVRLNGQEEREKAAYAGFTADCCALTASSHYAHGGFMGFLNAMTNVSLLAVLYVGGGLIAKGKLSAGSLTRFAMTSAFVGLGFSGLSTLHGDVLKALDAADRIFGVVDRGTRKNAGDCDKAVFSSSSPSSSSASSSSSSSSVAAPASAPASSSGGAVLELVDVHFSYPSRPDAPVLRGLTLSLSRPGLTAVVGKSGSGKSTLQALLCGLYRASRGQVSVCGRDVAGAERGWLQRQCGVVEQKLGLLSGTIAENIAYGLAEADVPRSAVVAAAKAAAAHDFISALPQGYDTPVGDGGSRLSGGQRARVALARAIIREPACLLLDECTAALDGDGEAEVVALLQQLGASRVVLVLTHSAALMAAAARVVVLGEGVVRAEGSMAELRAAGMLDDILTDER